MAIPIEDRRRIGIRLSGEPEDSIEVDEARHWRNTYRELAVGFAGIASSETATRRRKRDLQVATLKDRLEFWDRRWRELTAELG